jgi:hypothetical protein
MVIANTDVELKPKFRLVGDWCRQQRVKHAKNACPCKLVESEDEK